MAEQYLFAQFDTKEVDEFLDELREKVKALSGSGAREFAADVLTPLTFGDVINHFKNEEGPSGQWKRWTKEHAARMARKGKGGNKILQDNGRLRNSFRLGKDQPKDGFKWVNPAQTRGGFPYAYAHDTGGPILPQRKFMWLSDAVLEKAAEQVLEHLVNRKRGR